MELTEKGTLKTKFLVVPQQNPKKPYRKLKLQVRQCAQHNSMFHVSILSSKLNLIILICLQNTSCP